MSIIHESQTELLRLQKKRKKKKKTMSVPPLKLRIKVELKKSELTALDELATVLQPHLSIALRV